MSSSGADTLGALFIMHEFTCFSCLEARFPKLFKADVFQLNRAVELEKLRGKRTAGSSVSQLTPEAMADLEPTI